MQAPSRCSRHGAAAQSGSHSLGLGQHHVHHQRLGARRTNATSSAQCHTSSSATLWPSQRRQGLLLCRSSRESTPGAGSSSSGKQSSSSNSGSNSVQTDDDSSSGPPQEVDAVLVASGPSGAPAPEDDRRPWLLRLMSRLSPPRWVGSFVKALQSRDMRTVRLLRLSFIGMLFLLVAGMRHWTEVRTTIRTREVLYSDFVKLLDNGRVRSVRLESGTSRVYFDVLPKPQQQQQQQPTAADAAAAAPAAAVAAAAPTATAAATVMLAQAAVEAAKQPEATPAAAATAGTAAAAAAGTAAAAATAAPAATTAAAADPVRFQKQFVVKLADKMDYLLASRVLAAGVEFGVLKQSFSAVLANVFMTALALWIPLLPMFFLLKRLMDDRTSTKKKKSDTKGENVTITFKDVAGVDSAKEELMEVVSVMKSAKASYTRLQVQIPSGVLLCGPPGTGKTLLAKAVAGEAGIPFFAFSASEFVELFVGRGAARIREVFAEARKATPCVVFIDELDAVGARRGMGYNDERDQTLNQLLTELDGFQGRQGILFLAATNRMEILDPALLRPGRINRKVTVPLPSEAGRREILGVHLRPTPMVSLEDKQEACERIARVTGGFSGAELANVVNEATLLAARKDQDVVTLRELLEGVQRTKFGVNGAASPVSGWAKTLMDWASVPESSRKVKNSTI